MPVPVPVPVPVPAAQPLARNEGRATATVALPLPLPGHAHAHTHTHIHTHSRVEAPETLHPALWRAHQVARAVHPVWASGFAALDPHLPGGGWPAGALTELLLPHPGVGELRLLAPVLVAVQRLQRSTLWFDPPTAPCPWAMGALGVDMQQQIVVRSRSLASTSTSTSTSAFTSTSTSHPCGPSPAAVPGPGLSQPRQPAGGAGLHTAPRRRLPAADILWALEQALKSGQVGAVLVWLPQRLPADALRRLQLAAQLHEGPVFLLRAAEERSRASAAPLRLLLSAWGPDLLRVCIVKRRGAPLAEPLLLELPPVLSAPALARALRGPARGALPGLPHLHTGLQQAHAPD